MIKWVGVAYLLYLGFSAIFSQAAPLSTKPRGYKKGRGYTAFLKGFVLELSNPKALLYFSALLPQFIDILPSDKKRIHLFGKPSEAGADAERIGIYLQRVCHRGVSFSSAPLVCIDCICI